MHGYVVFFVLFSSSNASKRYDQSMKRPSPALVQVLVIAEQENVILFLFQPQTLYAQVESHSSKLLKCTVDGFRSIQVGGPPS